MEDTRESAETAENTPFLTGEFGLKGTIRDKRNLSFLRRLYDWGWVISTIFFASLSIFLAIVSDTRENYERGFATDLGVSTRYWNHGLRDSREIDALKSQIALHEVAFTGGLELNETGKLVRIIEPGQPQYVGLPTPEIDSAWNELMLGNLLHSI
jgi:hypothetical protein